MIRMVPALDTVVPLKITSTYNSVDVITGVVDETLLLDLLEWMVIPLEVWAINLNN